MKIFFTFLYISFALSVNVIDTIWVDASISKIQWIGNKVSGSHDGHIKIKSGYVLKKNEMLVGGEIIMDMHSISVDDIDHPKWNQSLLEHLKNEDFFDVEKFQTATLTVLSSVKKQINDKRNSNIEITGDLTIKGITKKVLIHSHIDFDKNISKGELVLDRTMWGIKYGSRSFFDNLGDRAIYDDFILNFDLLPKK